MPRLGSISTNKMHSQDTLDLWQKSAWMETGHTRSRWLQATSFQGLLEYGSLEEIKLYKLSVSPHRVISSPEGPPNTSGYIKAILQVKGRIHYEQKGREVVLEPGSWMLRDVDTPYCIDIREDAELIALILPRAAVSSNLFDLHNLFMRRFSGTSGLGHLVHDLIYNTYQEFDELDESLAPDLSAAITQLMRLYLMRMTPEDSTQALSEVLRERVRRYIETHLRAPDLSINQMARAMHCTKRYLHKVFEDQEKSISRCILDTRLNRCRDALIAPSTRHDSITKIALSWGFSNSAHFSRAFHDRFGVSPSTYRNSALAAPSQ